MLTRMKEFIRNLRTCKETYETCNKIMYKICCKTGYKTCYKTDLLPRCQELGWKRRIFRRQEVW